MMPRRAPPLALLVLACLAASAPAAGPAPDSTSTSPRSLATPVPVPAPVACVVPEDQDAAAVLRLLAGQVEAWNRGDLEGFMKGYWKSDSLTFYSGGTVSRGWQEAHDRYQRRYKAEGREMGTLVFDIHDVTLPARGQALVRGGWTLRMKDGRPGGLFTLWLRWFPEHGWRVVHDHTSSAAP